MDFIKREEAPCLGAPTAGATVQCDWFKNTNTTKHRTNEYVTNALVLRRGETFKVGMTFKGITFSEIMKTTLGFTIEAYSGSVMSIQKRCPIVDKIDESKWQMEVTEKDESRLYVVVNVNIPSNAIVGRYLLDVILLPSNESLKRHELVIVFNPWCKVEEVYLDNEEQRKEYVLNETGMIYQGSSNFGTNGITAKAWNYGQFEKNILDCVLLLLENDRRSQKNPLKTLFKRRSCLWVARILSAMVNSNDGDDGVLVGNWNYKVEDGGTPPYSWNGSVNILQQYYNNQPPNRAVRYGQCWVFAGVMTTALRALGIPARPVTNFDSGHDTDQTMTIDILCDEKGIPFRDESRKIDSFWNFHVWNEIWSTRQDLPGTKYDGWQAVDATPQELSFGLHQVGPAPVTAVKEGEIYAGFDTGFVFAEVNGEYIEWIEKNKKDEHGLPIRNFELINSQTIGKFISTKKIGENEREDITHLYKYAEGSPEERKAVSTAYSFGYDDSAKFKKFPELFNIKKHGKDLKLYMNLDPSGTVANGSNFKGVIKIENKSGVQITVDASVSLTSTCKDNKNDAHLIKSQQFRNVSVGVGETLKLSLSVTVQEYIHKLTEQNKMKMVAVVKVIETKKTYVKRSNFQLSNAKRITIQPSDLKLKVGQKSEVKVSFNNNLPIPLTNLIFTIEGAGLTPPIKERGDVLASGETMTKSFSITPYKSGIRTFIVDVDTKEIKDFKCFREINVEDASTYA